MHHKHPPTACYHPDLVHGSPITKMYISATIAAGSHALSEAVIRTSLPNQGPGNGISRIPRHADLAANQLSIIPPSCFDRITSRQCSSHLISAIPISRARPSSRRHTLSQPLKVNRLQRRLGAMQHRPATRLSCRSSLPSGHSISRPTCQPHQQSSERRTPTALELREHTSSGSKSNPPIDTSSCHLVFAQPLTIMLTTTTTTRSTADFNRVRFFTNVVLTC